jgi:hypothetical protein
VEGHLDDCVVLASGEPGHRSQSVHGQHPALGHLLSGLGDRVRLIKFGQRGRGGVFAPGLVAQNLMQPAAQMPDLGAPLERRESGQKRLLDQILGPVGIYTAGVCRQRPAVTLNDQLECPFVSQLRQSDQPFVGL